MDPENKEELKKKAKGLGKIAWEFVKGAAKVTTDLGKTVASEIDKSIEQAQGEHKKKKELDAILNQRKGSFLSIHPQKEVLDVIHKRLTDYRLPKYPWTIKFLEQFNQLRGTCNFAEADSQGKSWNKQIQLDINTSETADGLTQVNFEYLINDDCPESWVRKESFATNQIIHHANSHIKAAADVGA